MRGDVCGSRAAYVRGWLSSPHDARYHLWWYANSIALGVDLKGKLSTNAELVEERAKSVCAMEFVYLRDIKKTEDTVSGVLCLFGDS